jgi:hypothetical protein
MHAGLLHAGGMGVRKLMKPGSCAFGAVRATTTLVSTLGLDKIVSLHAKNVGGLPSVEVRKRETEGAGLEVGVKLSVERGIPFGPVGEALKIAMGEALQLAFFWRQPQ